MQISKLYAHYDNIRRYTYQRGDHLYVGLHSKSYKYVINTLKTSKRTNFILHIHLLNYESLATFFASLEDIKHIGNVKEIRLSMAYGYRHYPTSVDGDLFSFIKLLLNYMADNESLTKFIMITGAITHLVAFRFMEEISDCPQLKHVQLWSAMTPDKSLTELITNTIRKTNITKFIYHASYINEDGLENVKLINEACKIPLEEREIPIKSKTKSAAKIT